MVAVASDRIYTFSTGYTDLIFACLILDMWQSRVEIEHYSIAYFDHITTLYSTEPPLKAGLICVG